MKHGPCTRVEHGSTLVAPTHAAMLPPQKRKTPEYVSTSVFKQNAAISFKDIFNVATMSKGVKKLTNVNYTWLAFCIICFGTLQKSWKRRVHLTWTTCCANKACSFHIAILCWFSCAFLTVFLFVNHSFEPLCDYTFWAPGLPWEVSITTSPSKLMTHLGTGRQKLFAKFRQRKWKNKFRTETSQLGGKCSEWTGAPWRTVAHHGCQTEELCAAGLPMPKKCYHFWLPELVLPRVFFRGLGRMGSKCALKVDLPRETIASSLRFLISTGKLDTERRHWEGMFTDVTWAHGANDGTWKTNESCSLRSMGGISCTLCIALTTYAPRTRSISLPSWLPSGSVIRLQRGVVGLQWNQVWTWRCKCRKKLIQKNHRSTLSL